MDDVPSLVNSYASEGGGTLIRRTLGNTETGVHVQLVPRLYEAGRKAFLWLWGRREFGSRI